MTNVIQFQPKTPIGPGRSRKEQPDAEQLRQDTARVRKEAEGIGRQGLSRLDDADTVPADDRKVIAAALHEALMNARQMLGLAPTGRLKLSFADDPEVAKDRDGRQRVLSRLHAVLGTNRRLEARGALYVKLIRSISELTGERVELLADRVLRGTRFHAPDRSSESILLLGRLLKLTRDGDGRNDWRATYGKTADAIRVLLDVGELVPFPVDIERPDVERPGVEHGVRYRQRIALAAGVALSDVFSMEHVERTRQLLAASKEIDDAKALRLLDAVASILGPECTPFWPQGTRSRDEWAVHGANYRFWPASHFEERANILALPHVFVGIDAEWRNLEDFDYENEFGLSADEARTPDLNGFWLNEHIEHVKNGGAAENSAPGLKTPFGSLAHLARIDESAIAAAKTVATEAAYDADIEIEAFSSVYLVPFPTPDGKGLMPVLLAHGTGEAAPWMLPLVEETVSVLTRNLIAAPATDERPAEVTTMHEALVRALPRIAQSWEETTSGFRSNPALSALERRNRERARISSPAVSKGGASQ
jgi:hypothetical protein